MNSGKKWTDQEIDFLRANINTLSYEELASKLGRTKNSIELRKNKLKIKKGNQHPLQIGEKVERLTILRKTVRRGPSGQAYYECKCECGKIIETLGTGVRYGNTISCGCYNEELLQKAHRLNLGECSLNNLEHMCRGNAKKRRGKKGIPYKLTTEQFRFLIKQNCYWCGEKPKPWNVYYKLDGTRTKTGKHVEEEWASLQWVSVNGIDRLNSDLGYTLENCIPCCFPCNEMKMGKSEKEFIELMEKILNFQREKSKIGYGGD
jgi:hypothetical protein